MMKAVGIIFVSFCYFSLKMEERNFVDLLLQLLSLMVCCCHTADAARDSYSYHKFSGPVSGQIQEVYVPTATGTRGKTVDFVVSDFFGFWLIEFSLFANMKKSTCGLWLYFIIWLKRFYLKIVNFLFKLNKKNT